MWPQPSHLFLPSRQGRLPEQVGVLGDLGRRWRRTGKETQRRETESHWSVKCVFPSAMFSWLILSHVLGNLSPAQLSSSLGPREELAHPSAHHTVIQNLDVVFIFSCLLIFQASTRLSWTLGNFCGWNRTGNFGVLDPG